jgi:ribosomal protein L7/L12
MQDQLKIDQEIQSISKSKGKLAAIAYCRETLNLGLKEAKDYVENLLEQRPNIISENTHDLERKIRQLLALDKKLEAIKLHKETMNCDLKTSYDYINEILEPKKVMPSTIQMKEGSKQMPEQIVPPNTETNWFKSILRFFTGDKA